MSTTLGQTHRSLAEECIEQGLVEARVKRAKLEAFKTEADDLDAAINDLERAQAKALERRMARSRKGRKDSTLGGGKPTNKNVRGGSREKVMAFLKEADDGLIWAPAEIAKEIGLQNPYVSGLLADLVGAGEVEKVGRGAYRIKNRGNGANLSESPPVKPETPDDGLLHAPVTTPGATVTG